MPSKNEHNPAEYEDRWRQRWAEDGLDEVDMDASGDAKFYNLVEFPYPSAEGLHVGHVYTYCGADTFGRYQRMGGRRVFQPMGFDSFGIHTENYAIKVNERPDILTTRTVANYRRQLSRVGAAWSWSAEVVTSDPGYYRWTQWIFLKLFKAGLAERRTAPVIWCPSCLTVLANEQLEGERCERCGSEVTQRVMRQWFLKITKYADQLIDGLDDLDWPELAKKMQRDWIGRSRGFEVDFRVEGSDITLAAFTTRVDTLFGVTFVAIAPDHDLAAQVAGRRAIHPLTGVALPIVAAEYVVSGYGTGVVMGVPAHDQRDLDFALASNLPVLPVIESPAPIERQAWVGEGQLINSGEFNQTPSETARDLIAAKLAAIHRGRSSTRFRLHDWLISRQRYWGPPIPIVYCPTCGTVPVPEHELPVLLPVVDEFRPTGTGVSPLAAVPDFVNTPCPECGEPARRETDVSDTFLDSAWYFLRYPSSTDPQRAWNPDRTASWLPVDLYAGGREHVARHHLYARFVTRALYDLGLVPFTEPFPRLRLHGLLIQEGAKMSKSRGNVVNPDDYIDRVGSDNLRMYLLFCGAWEDGGDFSDRSLTGIVRFTRRLYGLVHEAVPSGEGVIDLSPVDRTVERIGRDIERFKFNTAIAALMEATTWALEQRPRMSAEEWSQVTSTLVLLLAPFAPHLAEELWSNLHREYSVHHQPWPSYSPAALVSLEVTLVIQVDGKVRARLTVPAGLSQERAVELALLEQSITRLLANGTPAHVVYVPDRLLNLVSGASV
jgi:leucyl-tRNA synthetase